jgi:hypothetical protein
MNFITKADRQIPYVHVEAEGDERGHVLLVHGIFGEGTEDGRFTRLAGRLAAEGLSSVQFDYSGHGHHSFESRRFTIASALADYCFVTDWIVEQRLRGPFFIVASSFGASLTLLYLRLQEARAPSKLILLNPVTDYVATFLKPQGQQMQERFRPSAFEDLRARGEADLGDGFIGTLPLILEFELYRPAETFPMLSCPTLVLHGDADTAVPYDVTKRDALRSPAVEFETIHGADHAFVEPHEEAKTFDLMTAYLTSAARQ